MDTHSVETSDPPTQAAIRSWRVWMGDITLEPSGDNSAELWFTSDYGAREPFGDVTFSTQRDRYIVAWNRAARMTLGSHQVEVIDQHIHYAMRNRR